MHKEVLELVAKDIESIIKSYTAMLDASKNADEPDAYIRLFNRGYEHGVSCMLARVKSLEKFMNEAKTKLDKLEELESLGF